MLKTLLTVPPTEHSLSLQKRRTFSACRRLYLQGCSFYTIYSSPWSHFFSFVGFQHPAVHFWPPAVLTVCTTASLHINSSEAKHSPTSSEPWDQFPGGSATFSSVMHSSKHSCHLHRWEPGEVSCILAVLLTSNGWLKQQHLWHLKGMVWIFYPHFLQPSL